MYAMYCLIQREIQAGSKGGNGEKLRLPEIFTDPGYGTLGTSVLSTSNCGNPALRVSTLCRARRRLAKTLYSRCQLFGFGPVTPEGHGIGYIIKDEGISM